MVSAGFGMVSAGFGVVSGGFQYFIWGFQKHRLGSFGSLVKHGDETFSKD